MRVDDPFKTLHEAVAAATYRDLPDIEYETVDFSIKDFKIRKNSPRIKTIRRPELYDIEIVMFPQTWGSTALGYGGVGGNAMTTAYTVIIHNNFTFCVYFGYGRLAYKVNRKDKGIDNFIKDMKDHNLVETLAASTRYG